MEQDAEETVQNCNFLDSKISEQRLCLKKHQISKKGVKVILTMWLQWHYDDIITDFGIITVVKRMNMCSFYLKLICVIYSDLKCKAKNSTFLTAYLPNP